MLVSQMHRLYYSTLFDPAREKHHFTLGCQLMYGQSWKEGECYLCSCSHARIVL